MRPASAKAKGVRLEKKFADMLVNAGLDQYAKRMVLSGAVRGFDGDIFTRLPIHVECKAQETWKPLEYYKQCADSNPSPARKMNVVVMDRNRLLEPMVMVSASDFITLMAYALEGKWE